MPLVRNTANQNIRRRAGAVRREQWISIAGPSLSASPIALTGSGSVSISGDSTTDLVESINSLRTYSRIDGYGREAKLEIFATAFLEMETYPLDHQSEFTMIKRVSPIMPNPLPLDSKGRPT